MASPILEQYRAQVPAAQGLDDEALAEEIRSRFYPEANPEQFKANLGVTRELSRPIDQYRAREPKAWGLNDQELVTELHSRFGKDQPIEEYAQGFGVAFGDEVGAEPSATGPGPSTQRSVLGQRQSDQPAQESSEPQDSAASRRGTRPEYSPSEGEALNAGADRRARRGDVEQREGEPVNRETRLARRNQQEREALGDVGQRFDVGRSEGLSQAATLAGAREGGVTDEPLRVDQRADEATETVYQMQGRGERSADDFRRGVNRARSAINTFRLVDAVSSLSSARERMQERDALSVDARMRLTGEDPSNPAYSPEAIERRLVSAEERDRQIIETEQQRAQEIAGRLQELREQRQDLGENVTLRRALEDGDAETFFDQLLSENGLDVMSGLVLESLPAMVPALGAGVAGGAVAGPAGFAAGTGTVSAITEGLFSVQEKLQEYGADLEDPESVARVWDEYGGEIIQDSATRAALIGAFDAASGGLAATRVIPRAGVGASFTSRATRNVAEGATQLTGQAAAGSAGEAGAQIAETGRIENPAAVAAEGVAEFGFAPVEVAGAAISGARRRVGGPQDARQLRERMVNEGFVENDDGTLRRGDIVVEIDENEARVRLDTPNVPAQPRPGTQDDSDQFDDQFAAIDAEINQIQRDVIAPANDPNTPNPSASEVQQAQRRVDELLNQREALTRDLAEQQRTVEPEQGTPPSERLDALISDFEQPQTEAAVDAVAPELNEQLANITQQAQERREALQSAGVPDDQIEIDPTLRQLENQRESLSNIQRQAATNQAEAQANKTIDANRQPVGDALGEQVERTRQEADDRSPLREEIQRLRQTNRAQAPLVDEPDSTSALQREIQSIRGRNRADQTAPRVTPINNPETGEFTSERVSTENIEIDPETYQFRDDVNRDGVDDRLEGITRFDDLRAGTVVLHEREDGRTFVADGHHRIDLARRLNRDSINAIVLREADGFSAADARRYAAERNIAEGNATAIDAAKVFRETGGDPASVIEDRDLPRRSQVVRDGAAIAQLSDDAFGALLNEQITEKDAAAIGRNFTDPDQQLAAVEQYQKVRPANETQREILANEIRSAGFSEGEQGGLFGDGPAESLIGERVRLLDALNRRFSRRGRLFNTLNENAGTAEQAGNRIAREQNEAIQQDAAAAIEVLRQATTTPSINQAINDAARRLSEGESLSRVVTDLEEGIINEARRLRSTPEGAASDSGVRPADQAGQDARGGESAPARDTGRDPAGGESGVPGAEPELLTQPTPEDLQARDQAEADRQAAEREAERRADADAQRDDFTLTGSDTEADQAAARGQDTLFSLGNPAEGPETPATPLDGATEVVVDGVGRPSLNSEGRPIHPTVEGVRNFWRWFGDSSAADEQGRPIALYHGSTTGGIEVFDTYGSNYGLMGQGSYFTDNPTIASEYSRRGRRQNQEPTVYPAYVSISNPIDMDAPADADAFLQAYSPMVDGLERSDFDGAETNEDAYRVVEDALISEGVPDYEGAEIMQEGLKNMGYDGITHIGGGRVQDDGARHGVWIAFDPEQIKSATGNTGNFDASEARIRFSLSGQQSGISTDQAAQRANQLMRDWRIAPRVNVARNEADLPRVVRDIIAANGKAGKVRGVFHDGEVFVVADNLESIAEMEEVILHEVLGHFGIRNVLGRNFNKVLDDAYLTIGRSGLEPIAQRYNLNLNKKDQRREAVEEYIAEMAEANPDSRIIDRVVRLIAEWARSMGFELNMTNSELRQLMIRAKRFTQEGEIVSGVRINQPVGGGVAMSTDARPDTGGISRFSFAGARSQEADLGNLETAQALEENGAGRTSILQQTGWFKGPDGMWRYEISDDQARLNDSDLVTADAVLEEIGDQFVVTDKGGGSDLVRAAYGEGADYIAAFGRDEESARQSLARQIAKRRTPPNAFDPEKTEQLSGQFYRLEQILEHPKLFAAYPSLSSVMVHIRNLDGARGRYRDDQQMIDIAPLEREQFFSTLLHEIQHAIQSKEGFARGGSSDFEFWRAVVDGIKELDTAARNRALGWQFENQDRIDRAEEAAFNATMGLVYQSAQRLRDYASRERPSGVYRLIRKESQWLYEPTFDRLEGARDLQREFFNLPRRGPRRNEAISDLAYQVAETLESQIPDELLSEFRSDQRKTENMVRALQRDSRRARADLEELTALQREAQRARNIRESERLRSPYETYQALAGEIEARNTQTRLEMTPEQRSRTTPDMTQDVEREEAIVIFGGLELQVPQASIAEPPEPSAVRFSRRGVREANASKEKTAAANRSGFPVKFRNDAAKETTAYVAKDRQGNWVTVKTSDPSLREQNALKAWVKKKFTKEGQLTDRAYELHTQMLGQRNADEIDISGFTADFIQAVSRAYGRSYMRLDDNEKALLNEYLAGQDVQGIPDAVKAELDVMRGMLDNASTRTQMMLLDEVKYALQDMSGDQAAQVAELIRRAKEGDNEAISEIREVSPKGNLIARKMRTFLAIEANKGGYLHRSYRAFDDPSWKNNVPEDVMRRAKDYLRDQVRRDPTLQGLDASGVEDRVDGIVNVILNSNSSDMVDFLSQSQLGEKDLSVLKQRENIPEPIRELMGEYKDPRINFSRTMSHMSTLLASHHFLRSVREEGLGVFLSAQPSGRMSQEITSFNEEKMLPLAGLYATPEFRQALIEFAEGNNLEGWVKDLVRVTSSVKYGKTVLSPTTMARNFYSAAMFTVMNGHFDYSNIINAAQTTWADIRGNTRARRDYMRRLAELGVIHDSARAGEIAAALDDIMDLDTTRGSAPVRAGKETLNVATRMYQAGDDFWKIVGYETELKDLVNSGMAREDAEALAAKRVRDGYPTYSMVPEAIQQLRRFPLVGTFVSFPWEIMRTSFNQLRMTREDFQAGRNAKAARRLVGMSIAYSSAYAIKTATMAMFGIDDEEDEAVRKLAAPWQMNSQFAYLGHDEEGRMRYLDLSHLDPYNHLKRPITALMNGNYDNVGEGAVEGMKEFLAPYLGTDITAGVIGEIWANKKQGSGTPVYDEEADILTQGYQAGNHLMSSLRPGVLLNVERTLKAFNDQMTSYGREYTLEDEALAWVGFRLTTSDPKVSMQFKSFDFSDSRSAAGRPTYRALRDPNIIDPSEVADGVENTYTRWQEAFEEMHAVVRAGRVAGLSDQEIAQSLDKGGVPQRDIAFIIREQVPPWSPSNQSMENAINSVLEFNDTPEMRENIQQRFRAMRRAVIEQRRDLMNEQNRD